MDRINEGQYRQQFQALQIKAQGGTASLSDEEREQYRQLLKLQRRS